MNILITGVHGFVGSNLVKALSPENTIYGLDIVAPEKEGIVKTFLWDDLGGIDLPQIDAVIHLLVRHMILGTRVQRMCKYRSYSTYFRLVSFQ